MTRIESGSGADARFKVLHVFCIQQIRCGDSWYYNGELRGGVADFVPQRDDALEMDREEAEAEFASLRDGGQLPPESDCDGPAEIKLLHSVRVPNRESSPEGHSNG
jgi:hypothetical protein